MVVIGTREMLEHDVETGQGRFSRRVMHLNRDLVGFV